MCHLILFNDAALVWLLKPRYVLDSNPQPDKKGRWWLFFFVSILDKSASSLILYLVLYKFKGVTLFKLLIWIFLIGSIGKKESVSRKERRAAQAIARKKRKNPMQPGLPAGVQVVQSLLDAMQEGNEYGSIVGLAPASEDLVPEIRRAIADIEKVRGRRCLCYVANVIKNGPDRAIQPEDHLPFNEMIGRIPQHLDSVDILLATPGGSAEQVSLMVDAVRSRFGSVEFILPYIAMSAGTLWALSGDRIWMDRRSFIGPMDPQVPSTTGMWVPAQSILTLLKEIQTSGDQALLDGKNIPWAHIRLLDHMDQHQLGNAINSTNYVINIAASYLEKYKFRNWDKHSSTGQPVAPEERKDRAFDIARKFCSHELWKAHGHGINREVASTDLMLKIDQLEDVEGLERAVRRLWALCYYIFDKSPAIKMLISQEYAFVRNAATIIVPSPFQPGGPT